MEVFQNMWFTPIRERPNLDSAALLRKVMNITDVVAASRDMGLEWFEQLLLSTQGDYQIISSVARTLELVVPLMEHPSETFLAQLEEDSVKLILQHDRHLTDYKKIYEKEPENPMLVKCRPFFRRALFTVGLLLRHFDFMDKDVINGLPEDIKDQVFETLLYFVQQPRAKLSKQENLKEMGDVSSGMASTVIQLYLKEILESFLHPNIGVRHAALKVIQLILAQGLVHPVQIVPYLICMSTDVEKAVSHSADKQLQDIEKKYPGFIHMKSQSGIRLSYKLQKILQQSDAMGVVRGFRVREGEIPGALNGFLYSILRSTKQQRRALVLSILKQFDDQVGLIPNGIQNQNEHGELNPQTGTITVPSYLEEEEDEDEEVLLARVPEDTTTLQDCITASQGCLLLLVLKDHLKELYGISDA
uniref:Nipped-B protein n=1 Tax=Timema shepardi TaxID=629360 RepID=A0A7R9B8G2_TIMSH|nr:unnamed protein product [Timema shepardi]